MSLMGENGGGGAGWRGGGGLCLDSEHLVLVTVDPVDSNFVFVGGGWGVGGGYAWTANTSSW